MIVEASRDDLGMSSVSIISQNGAGGQARFGGRNGVRNALSVATWDKMGVDATV
jgi:hypothetical protein